MALRKSQHIKAAQKSLSIFKMMGFFPIPLKIINWEWLKISHSSCTNIKWMQINWP